MHFSDDHALDGNALAGPMAELFAVDVTTALVMCNDCGAAKPLAEQAAYVGGPGSVLRCSGCSSVLVRFVQTRNALWLDTRGSKSWQMPAASA
ncbi:MAG: DUF6510 family protein [Humibacillus sp.]|nr:DUF6510 family protein [Humibacillus sp.]MDN5776062.1 DUF6510 family protein [Humibacillus sp.]